MQTVEPAARRDQPVGQGLATDFHSSLCQSAYASSGLSVATRTDASYFAATSLTG